MEGGKNGMEQYNDTATIEKHAFDIAKNWLGDDEGNTTTIDKDAFAISGGGTISIGKGIIIEIGGRTGVVEMRRRNMPRYTRIKPPDEPSPLDPAVPLYATDKIPRNR